MSLTWYVKRFPGLNKFDGFSIDGAELVLPAESDGTNLVANATLPNQSILTLEIVR